MAIAIEESIEKILSLNKEEKEKLYALGYSYYEQEKYKQAEKTFKILLISDSLHYDYWFGYASTLYALKQWARAAKAYATAVLLDPEAIEPHLFATKCFVEMQEYEEAKKALNQIIIRDKKGQFQNIVTSIKQQLS